VTERAAMVSVLGTVCIALLAVTALLALLVGFQRKLVFFPDGPMRLTPAQVGLPAEDVTLATADGLRLGAWWIPAESERGALVFAHGNAGNIGDRLDFAAFFRGHGLSVLLFDYRGYGRSDGTPGERGTHLDMDAAVAFVASRGFGPARTVLYGESLGGAVAIAAAVRHRPAALVVASTFTSVPDVAHVHYPWAPRALVHIGYDSLRLMPQVSCPVLVLHGPDDRIIPFAMGEALFHAAREPKRFARLVGDHNDGGILRSPEAQRALTELLNTVLPAHPS
jgi:uncharacterized protein